MSYMQNFTAFHIPRLKLTTYLASLLPLLMTCGRLI